MQPLATAGQIQSFDRTAITKLGISGLVLMENAGRAFVDELEKKVPPTAGKHVTVLCGKGNNGGDGFVIARHLLNRCWQVEVGLLCKPGNVQGDARTNLDILLKLLKTWAGALKITRLGTPATFSRLHSTDVIVDAVFGTGFKGKASGVYLRAIRWMNRQKAFVAAVDISSGANASTGVVEGEAVRADLTVTMALAKIGHYVGAGREHSGEVVVADISIPKAVLEGGDVRTFRVTSGDVRIALPRRPLTAHKYSVGKVFVLAGSRKFTGAPFMCAQAAMRTGAGAVILGTPKSVQPLLARRFTEVMMTPLDETPDGAVALSARDAIRERVEWADVVIVGPGLSRGPETQRLLLQLIPEIKKPLVLDADALFMVAADPGVLARRKRPAIITPHTGELSAIMGSPSSHVEVFRVETSRMAAKSLRSIVCLKGSPTVTANPEGEAFLNPTGNPGMATIGSGDVLTGIIGSLVGQGVSLCDAAWAGVFIHGLAGDLAAQSLGQRSVMALDILEHVPDALKALLT